MKIIFVFLLLVAIGLIIGGILILIHEKESIERLKEESSKRIKND